MLSRTSGILFLTIIFSAFLFSQNKQDETVIAKYGKHNITVGEFNQAYAKNGQGSGNVKKGSLSNLDSFLHLYLIYKMKLADGYSRGYEKDPSVLKELKSYNNQLKEKLLIDRKIIEPNLNRLYERGKLEYRVSHIMFTPEKGHEKETLKIAQEVLDSVKNGTNFAQMAEKYSQDRYSRDNGGDLYYITSGQLPLSIENAVYSTEKGEVYPKLVKSNFGYHIIKVTDKRERRFKIRASHILLHPKANENATPEENQAMIDSSRQLADTVLQKLKAGGDFTKLALEYSMDEGSAMRGGDIGFFSRNQTVRSFDEAAFNLKKVGDISGVVKSPFGYHIIKLTGILDYPSFKDLRDELLKQFKAKQYNEIYDNLLDSLRIKYKYEPNYHIIKKIQDIIDTAKGGIDLSKLPASFRAKTIFTAGKLKLSVNDYIDQVKSLPQKENESLAGLPIRQSVAKIAGEQLLAEEADNYKKNDPALKSMLEDYKKGAIIFKIQQEEVWNRVKIDSASVYDYFRRNEKKYMWPDRVKFTELFTLSDSLIHHYKKLLASGANFDTLCAKYTERKGYKERGGHWTLRDINHNDLYQKAWKMKRMGEYSDIYKNFGGYSIIRLDLKDPAHIKTFEEAKPEVSSDYQEKQMKKLEEAYEKKLAAKYKPIIYMDRFEKIYKKNK